MWSTVAATLAMTENGVAKAELVEVRPVIVRTFPEVGAQTPEEREFLRRFRCRSMVIHGHSRRLSYDEHPGNLSIKCAFGGEETYEVRGRTLRVDEGCFLLLNQGQRYRSEIASVTPVESLSIFFRPGLAEEVTASLRQTLPDLLDNPRPAANESVRFLEGLYPHHPALELPIFRIRRAAREGGEEAGWLEEQFHHLLEGLLQVQQGERLQLDAVPALRAGTREELYRRLREARDYLYSAVGEGVDLEQAARVACLSKHHFLRLFKQVYGETPHQFYTRRRLAVARRQLRDTELPVSQIAADLGFEHPGSLSRLFRAHFGCSPEQFRRGNGAAGRN